MPDEKDKRDPLIDRLFPGLQGAFTGPSFSDYNLGGGAPQGGGGGGGNFGDIIRMLIASQENQPEETPSQFATTKAMLRNPQKFEQQQYEARLARDPWGPGGQFEGRRAADLYTPEQIVASGGMTAENQLRSQQKKTDTFDPEELKRLNEQYRRTYVL